MKHIYFLLLACLSLNAFSQTPQGISYQGVLRNLDGSIISGANITITFRIHDSSPDGIVVYEENHATTTGSNGLVNLTVGAGTAVTGIFSQIAWGAGNKYLQVLMDNGSGEIDLGTQQMMSVPYALYAEKSNTTNISVSAVGDTLYLGNGNYVLIPGISNSNAQVETGLGATLLPGVSYCADKTISASGCDGMTELEYQGYTYDLVEIAGQCWFKENLRATSFNDGTPITYEPSHSVWNSLTGDIAEQPYYAFYNNDSTNLEKYGNLYNAFTLENENICPMGWHVPTMCDTYYLISKQGVSNSSINNYNPYSLQPSYSITTGGIDNLVAHKLFSTDPFEYPYGSIPITPTNSSGFSAKAGGRRNTYADESNDYNFEMWVMLNTPQPSVIGFGATLETPGGIYFNGYALPILNSGQGTPNGLFQGRSIRCIKD
jgi:uncharacterized protein (TIGR02145 family)